MSISVVCRCGKKYQVRDEMAGKRAKCAACGAAISIPKRAPAAPVAQAKSAAPSKAVTPSKPVASSKPVAPSKPAANNFFADELADTTKTCPSCKSKVKHDVVLCINCGYNFRERKKQDSQVVARPAPSARLRCTKCGSHDTRKVNHDEFEAYTDRKETLVTIGHPLVCEACGHMFEPPASLKNYLASYALSAAFFVAGAAVALVTGFVAWKATGGTLIVEDDGSLVSFSPYVFLEWLRPRRNLYVIVFFFAGLFLAGAGLWGMLRTLIVQMGWKGILYDPDENK